MRALVNGAVNDKPTKILLDTGANISAVSAKRLMKKARHDMEINVQGIGKSKVPTTARITVKVTLGWQIVYEFDVWIMDHHAGVDLILGTDFMIPAGIRLDLFNSTAKLPDEVVIPLL
jgi:predicted aspartyl protease